MSKVKNTSRQASKMNNLERGGGTTQKMSVGQVGGVSFLEKYGWHLVVLISVVSFFIRVYRLDYQSLWVDEYVHADAARNFLEGKGHFWGDYELNQLFVNVLSSLSTMILGYSDFALRFPIALLSVIGIPAIYVLGKKLFHHSVGLMGAFLFAFSQYLIFWARIDRAYGLVPGLYMWVLYLFFCAMEDYQEGVKGGGLLGRIGVNQGYFLLFLGVFIVAFLTQIQVFLFFFSAGFYALCIWVGRVFFVKGGKKVWVDKYGVLSVVFIVIMVMLFVPIFTGFLHRLVGTFLPSHMADLIVPNWKKIGMAMNSTKRFESFNNYWGVMSKDLNYFWVLGCGGFVLSFFINKQSGIYLLACFLMPLGLMSFVLREPNLGKYMSFYYPVFLISGGVFLYVVYKWVNKYVSILKVGLRQGLFTFLGVGIMFFCIPVKKIYFFLTTEHIEGIVDGALAETNFPPWKKYIEYILSNKKDGDIIISTLPGPLHHYLKLFEDTYETKDIQIFQFRQRVIDFVNKKWVNFPVTEENKKKGHAHSLEGLEGLFNHHERGWVISDYYFYKPTSDERCVSFCIKNMTYHLNAGEDGAIRVMSWDKKEPKTIQATMLVELGKVYNEESSGIFQYQIPENLYRQVSKFRVNIVCEGVESGQDGVIQINQIFKSNLPIESNTVQVNGMNIKTGGKGFKILL